MTLEKACDIHEKKAAIKRQQEFEEQHKDVKYGFVEDRQDFDDRLDHEDWKMARLFMQYFTAFADRDYKEIYRRTQWDRGSEESDAEAIAREEAGYAAYKAAHPEPESADDLTAEMEAENRGESD